MNDTGEWCSDQNAIKTMIVDHFRGLFLLDDSTEPSPLSNSAAFPRVDPALFQMLEASFTSQDVLFALKGMQPCKAPGPGGFHVFFFQRYWPIVGTDVCDIVLQVLRGSPIPGGINDTYITLIPKVPYPKRVAQFRPIGLCNVIYKLITKCIVNKLKRVLSNLISPMQSNFVPGRQITDNVIIMQEVIHSMRRKTGATGWMAIKLDLEKAHDRLRWDFIHDTLLQMKLSDTLVAVIMNCISSSSLNILWNGVPTESFTPSRGYVRKILCHYISLWPA